MDREDRDALIARYLPEGWHLEDELALLAVQSGEKQSVMEQRLQVMDHYINYTLSGAEAVTAAAAERSEEHTSELQSLMRISYAVFCLKKKKKHIETKNISIKKDKIQDKQHTKTKR